jgi:hypothetical protein
MKSGQFFKNLVSAFLIVSFLAPSVFLWPEQAAAQNTPPAIGSLGSTSAGDGVPNGPADPAAQAWKDKSCGALLGGAVKSLFGSATKSNDVINSSISTGVEGASQQGTAQANSVPTYDASANLKLDQINQKTTDIKTGTDAINKKQNCLDSIARIMMKVAIRQITFSIIDWINHGYEGKPFFLSNPEGFFKDIAKNEFLTFGASIGNPTLFPFGKNFLIGATLAFKNKFEQNARYSLNELIAKTNPGMTAANFNVNFRTGGWDAWLGLTQVPANNPIGFSIMASNQLQAQLAGTQQSKAVQTQNQLIQSGGFLGDERCVDPVGVTHADDAKARQGDTHYSRCNQWEYVTPGKLIAERITYAQNSPIQSLQMADDINSALAAIADAALNQLVQNYSNKGLKYLTDSGNTETYNLSSNGTQSQSSQFPDSFVTPGSWISRHLDFNMKTDVTQAFVDEQRTYSSKLSSYNDALAQLITWIRQLDYCIPGPNPDWQANSAQILDSLGGTQGSSGKNGWEKTSEILSFSSLAAVIPGAGTWIALGGTLGSVVAGAIGQSADDKKARGAAAAAIERVLGVNIDHAQTQMNDTGGVKALLSNVFNEYAKKINQIYFSNQPPGYTASQFYMPGVTAESRSLFENIPGYQKIIENNNNEIVFRKSIITRLGNLKQNIDDLNAQLGSGAITQNQYDSNFTPTSSIVAEFARLSQYFVDGDDIANVDNLYKESISKKDYIHDDLLTGPYGCETELGKLWQNDRVAYQTYVRREPYPYPIDHLYGPVNSTTGGPYSIPWSQGVVNSMDPNEGFLHFSYYYNNHGGPFDIGSNGVSPSATTGSGCNAEALRYVHDFGAAADTQLSLPNSDKSGNIEDVGGLSTSGRLPNTCGVVLNFEKSFAVY